MVELRVHGVGGPTPENVLNAREAREIEGGDESAGFYTRDALGPSDQVVEAFVWGGLTSRTKLQGAWWLLLPFSLVNLAGWMLRGGKGADSGHEKSWVSSVWWTRLLLTVGGVVLTVSYVVWSAVALLDVVAFQCGADGNCVNRSWLLPLRWLDGDPVWRITLGMFSVVVVAVGLLFAARRTHRHEQYEPNEKYRLQTDTRRGAHAKGRGRLSRNDNLKHPSFWYRGQEWRRLYYWHAYVVVAVLGGIYGFSLAAAGAQGLFRERSAETPAGVWSGIVVVLALVALAAVVGPLRGDRGQPARPRLRVGAVIAVAATGILGGLGGWAWQAISDAGEMPLEGGLGLMTGVWVLYFIEGALLFVGLWPVIANSSPPFRGKGLFSVRPPKSDGWRVLAPAGVVTFALLVANGGFGAVVTRLVDLLDRGDESMVDIGVGSAGLSVDVFLVVLVAGLLALIIPFAKELLAGKNASDQIAVEYPTVWKLGLRRRIVWARALSQIGRNVDRLFTTVTLLIIVVFLWTVYRLRVDPFDDVVRPLMGFGGEGEKVTERIRDTWALAMVLYVFPGAFVVRAGFRNRGTRRQVGKVWESITFFPRRFHPLGAPSYAEKAVPMLREHIRDRAGGNGRLVIRAHSQGTVLTYAALSQLIGETQDDPRRWVAVRYGTTDCADAAEDEAEAHLDAGEASGLEHVALVTMGSPMGQLHAAFFPNYFCTERYWEARTQISGLWENYYRETDYIGKAVFVDPDTSLDEAGKSLKTGSRPPPPDHSIADPRPRDEVLHSHSNYGDDAEVIAQIETSIGTLTAP